MSQDYIFNFSHGLAARSSSGQDPIQRVGLEQQVDDGNGSVLPTVFDTGAGMLSEMFNFPSGGSNSATELLVNQINYHQLSHNQNQNQNQNRNQNQNQNHSRNQRQPNPGDWYSNTAQAMQLFITNPSSHESPSSQTPSSSTLHMLLPNSTLQPNQSFGGTSGPGQGHFSPSTLLTWVTPSGTTVNNVSSHESETLSLSLSPTLQHLEAAKVEELRISDDDSGAGGMVYFNQVAGDGGDPYRNFHMGQTQQPIHVGFGSSSSLGIAKVLRSSRYVKAVQELLEEFCSVGRGHFKKNKKHNNPNQNPENSGGGGGGGGGGGASSSSKDLSPLSSADKIEHQRRKVKLSFMLDEVDRRYNHYCEQMQTIVNSFDLVMGIGAAVPYTALAQKAMSRHFRCLKDVIAAQLKHSCELLGEKDISSGVTKGETPRLKLLEQSLRQQRAFHHMGMMEQEAWRPQRGLPERSINVLRAWLFEHFLHPYPNDADKHLLARQTGLSRNQVSNWFINARVRLWKPMVEDMYQQESKDEEEEEGDQSTQDDQNGENNEHETNINYKNGPSSSSSSSAFAQTPMPPPPVLLPHKTTTTTSEINDLENDPSILAINTQNCSSENQATNINYANIMAGNIPKSSFPATHDSGSTLIRFGGATGDVSLTLGLRHAGNLPDKVSFSVTDYGEC